MVALYELTNQYKELLLLAATTDCTEEEVAAKLHSILDNFNVKAESIGNIILDMGSDVEAIKQEESRLNARRKALETRKEWLKKYLLQEMVALHEHKIKSACVTIAVRVSPPSVEIVSLADIPTDYWRIIPETKEVDKRKITQHFKDTGEIISGCSVVTDKNYLEVR